MLRQKASGKILCLCSKNVQEDVDRVFRERPDMRIREEDVVMSKINWQPKSRNITEMAEELNLGLDSFIFVDDNPVECFTRLYDERMITSGVDPGLLKNPDYVKVSPILDDYDKFDASFFGYTPREASMIDPQQRLFLGVLLGSVRRCRI